MQPDILIVCGPVTKKFLDFPPALVVEILFPSTALKDRNTKFELYMKQGVKYYLIADVENKTIEAYTLSGGAYKILQENPAPFRLQDDCSMTPDLSAVFD